MAKLNYGTLVGARVVKTKDGDEIVCLHLISDERTDDPSFAGRETITVWSSDVSAFAIGERVPYIKVKGNYSLVQMDE